MENSSPTLEAKVTKVEELQGIPGVYQVNLQVKALATQFPAMMPAVQIHCGAETARVYKRLHAEDEVFLISIPM